MQIAASPTRNSATGPRPLRFPSPACMLSPLLPAGRPLRALYKPPFDRCIWRELTGHAKGCCLPHVPLATHRLRPTKARRAPGAPRAFVRPIRPNCQPDAKYPLADFSKNSHPSPVPDSEPLSRNTFAHARAIHVLCAGSSSRNTARTSPTLGSCQSTCWRVLQSRFFSISTING